MIGVATWLACPVARPAARERIVCFPHAGGSAKFFRDWGVHLPDSEVHAVRYPGRAERIDEPPPDDLRLLGRQIAEALGTLDDRPLVLFGHSMGAAVALETARALEAAGVTVAHLFASGSRDAPCPAPVEYVDPDDDTLIGQLVSLGGTDAALALDPLFQELVLPYVRSDGRMFHTYDFRLQPELSCPVTTIVGDADVDSDLRPWRRLSRRAVREHVVSGDHFYLISAPPFSLIQDSLTTLATQRHNGA